LRLRRGDSNYFEDFQTIRGLRDLIPIIAI
jgi:hypothetical protein